MASQKKLTEMTREELLEVVHSLILVISRKKGRDLQPNREANRRHQRHKHIWGRKKREMLRLLDLAVAHCPDDLYYEIQAVLDHEEDHYQRRDASTRRRREFQRAVRQEP